MSCDAVSLSILLFSISRSALPPAIRERPDVLHVFTRCAQTLCMTCRALRCTKTCWSDGNTQPPLAPSLWADSPCSDLTCTPAPAQENVTGFCRLLEPGECDNRIICSHSEKQVLTTQEDDDCWLKNKVSFKRRDIDGPLAVKYAV